MSWIEVESKLKVKDVTETRKKIKKIAKFVKREKKVDEYYALNYSGRYPKKSLRVRNKGKICEVNFKSPISYIHGVHAKREVEFRVSDLKGFFDLLNEFGFKKWLKKEKLTELYLTENGVHIELNEVKGLGWFIELEVLCKEKNVKKARSKISFVRKKLGYSDKGYVEKKGYTKELWEKKKN